MSCRRERSFADITRQSADAILAKLHSGERQDPADLERPLHEQDWLEIGCGTGLLSTQLAPQVGTLLGVDTSQGMIDVFNTKTKAHPNMSSRCLLLERSDQLDKQFDVITSNLLLHHIADLEAMFKLCLALLRPGGRFLMIDFEDTGSESRLFHPQSKHGDVEHHGIDAAKTRQLLRSAGFARPDVEPAFTMEKDTEEGSKSFPFILVSGIAP